MSFHNHDTEDYNKKYDPAGRKAAELAAKPQDEETVKTLMQLVRYGWDAAAEKILDYCIKNKTTPQFSDMIMEMLDEKNKNQFVWENFESKFPITQRTYSEQDLLDVWDAAIKRLLQDIAHTFLDPHNIEKADTENDKVVLKAIGETIINFPKPDSKQYLKQKFGIEIK